MWTLERRDFDALLHALRDDGRTVLGPTERDGVVTPGPLRSASDLPNGRTDRQRPGHYELVDRNDEALFGYAVGPESWKRHLFPAEQALWTSVRDDHGAVRFEPATTTERAWALVGVRPCELHAIRVLDRVLRDGPTFDHAYRERREATLTVVVQCGEPSETCFCASTGTGPRVDEGFDLAMTELLDDDHHVFVMQSGSREGDAVLARLPLRPADEHEIERTERVLVDAERRMVRRLDVEGMPDALDAALEHPVWTEVGARCLSCGNCTSVCPTCFCHDVIERAELDGRTSVRVRQWDSCFSPDHSYLHGGRIRRTTASRYRQWLTHKLGAWVRQFGSSGCVGCGRCITWCPAEIDLTRVAQTVRAARTVGAGEEKRS